MLKVSQEISELNIFYRIWVSIYSVVWVDEKLKYTYQYLHDKNTDIFTRKLRINRLFLYEHILICALILAIYLIIDQIFRDIKAKLQRQM